MTPTSVLVAKERGIKRMRLTCFYCGESTSNPLPDDTVLRGIIQCPECIEKESEGENWKAENKGLGKKKESEDEQNEI